MVKDAWFAGKTGHTSPKVLTRMTNENMAEATEGFSIEKEEVDEVKEHIEQLPEERDDYYSDDDLYNISSWGADLSFRELIQRYDEDDLIKPEIQRNYVWDRAEASRFIDSILLGLPVPSIFLAKTPDDKMLIVDGYQRIMTVRDFVRGIFSTDNKVFKLVNTMRINARWRGKAFSELPDAEQRKIRNTTIHSIVFVQNHPKEDDTSLYQIFERINTGGRTLYPQEIRNCVYQGTFNRVLLDLNKKDIWRSVLGSMRVDPRMRDVEMILRFFALSTDALAAYNKEQLSLKKFLNDAMEAWKNGDSQLMKEKETLFLRTMHLIVGALSPNAFENISWVNDKPTDKFTGKFSPTIFDSFSIAFLDHTNSGGEIPGDLVARRMRLLQSPEYQNLIRIRTTNKDRILARVSMAKDILFG